MTNSYFEEELTDEGKQMLANMGTKKALMTKGIPPPKKPKEKVKYDPRDAEIEFLRSEIARMIKNSENVIRDCDGIIAGFTTMEEYLTSDAKVAKTLHLKNIERLTRVLDMQPAFDYLVKLDDE